MDSSFLTWINVGLATYSVILFLKMLIQFGLPNHPARVTTYIVGFSVAVFFVMKAAVGLSYLSPLQWLSWRPLPIVTGSLAILFQIIMIIGSFSLIQQKVISRLPFMTGLLCLAFFRERADVFMYFSLGAAAICLTISHGKARYQKRLYFKMIFFLLLFTFASLAGEYWVYVIGECFLFFAIFYFFLFEQSFALQALIENKLDSLEGQQS